MPQQLQLFVVRFEQNASSSDRWKIYLGAVETGKVSICAQRGDNTSVLSFKAQDEDACTYFVENLLWCSSVETSLLLVPERAFMRGFEALVEARADDQVDSLSVFDGVLTRTEIEEYIKQICYISVA